MQKYDGTGNPPVEKPRTTPCCGKGKATRPTNFKVATPYGNLSHEEYRRRVLEQFKNRNITKV